MKQNSTKLDSKNLTIKDLVSIISNKSKFAGVSGKALSNVKKAHDFLEKSLKAHKKIIYGINTGFGPMANYILPREKITELQNNLILSHAVGMGKKLPDEFVRAAMLVRLNTLAKGYSGVSPELIKQLTVYINHQITPIVPEHGAVGTSGDLVQLAHIALALIGKGKATYKGKIYSVEDLIKKLDIKPYKLKPKEGLSLINGTSMMTGIAGLICFHSRKLTDLAILNGCLALELLKGYDDSFSQKLHSLRPQKGQISVAKKMREILRGSKLIRSRGVLHKNINNTQAVNKIPESVQEVYSMRCIAQILGPTEETLDKTWKITEIEMNSVTDNPIVDWKSGHFLHGGNFHGEYIAQSMDNLKASLVKLTMLSERRLNFFLNPNINKNLPPFLNLKTPGLNLGLQALQFVATSTTAGSQTLAFPMSVHSISTNGDNQDVVSMGTDAALLAHKIIENAYIVLSIEAIALAQAVDYLKIQTLLSKKTKSLYTKIRSILPKIVEDREITSELSKVTEFLRNFEI